jgi:hypothetical protein
MINNKWILLAVVMTILFLTLFIFLTYSKLPTDTANLTIYLIMNGCFGVIGGVGSTMGIYLHMRRWERISRHKK